MSEIDDIGRRQTWRLVEGLAGPSGEYERDIETLLTAHDTLLAENVAQARRIQDLQTACNTAIQAMMNEQQARIRAELQVVEMRERCATEGERYLYPAPGKEGENELIQSVVEAIRALPLPTTEAVEVVGRLVEAAAQIGIVKHVRLVHDGGTVPNGASCKFCGGEWGEGEPEKHHDLECALAAARKLGFKKENG